MKETYTRKITAEKVAKVLTNNNKRYNDELAQEIAEHVKYEEIENLTMTEEILFHYSNLEWQMEAETALEEAFNKEVKLHLKLMKTGKFPEGSSKEINEAKSKLMDLILAAESHEGKYPKYPYNFYIKEEGKFVTMFNETNDAWVEEFEELGQALAYLKGLSTDEAKATNYKKYIDIIFATDPGPGSAKRVAAVDNVLIDRYGYFGAFPHSVFEIAKKLWHEKSKYKAEAILADLIVEIESPSQHQLPDDYISIIVIEKERE